MLAMEITKNIWLQGILILTESLASFIEIFATAYLMKKMIGDGLDRVEEKVVV